MSVTWYTEDAQDAPTLRFGTSPDALTASLPATTTSYLAGHGYHHSALIEGLECDVDKVYYAIDSEDEVR